MSKWQNRKGVIVFLVLSLLILLSGWILLIWNELAITEYNPNGIAIASLDDGYECNVESVEWERDGIFITKDYITLSGWFLKPGADIRNVALKIVLKNQETGRYYLIPTTMEVREDVIGCFSEGYDYNNSGFRIKIPHDGQINVDQYDYGIYVLYTLNEDDVALVSLGTTLRTWRNH